jgi:hypothetical protein
MPTPEIDKFIVERFPVLNHKPALMRAYKRTISRDGGGDGDDYVVRVSATLKKCTGTL